MCRKQNHSQQTLSFWYDVTAMNCVSVKE